MERKIYKNATVLTENFQFIRTDIETVNNLIKYVGNISHNDAEIIDCDNKYIVPGLVDIHTHGCVGYDSADCTKLEDMRRMRSYYARNGITTYLATIATSSVSDTEKAVSFLTDVQNDPCGANIGGIHLEGPYFSHSKKGAQNPDFLRLPDINEFEKLNTISNGNIKLISVAPELENAYAFISHVSKKSSVSIGHTEADYECASKAIDCGATVMTHTFNGMLSLHHRNPGAVGAALDRSIFCEFICDGFHINEAVIRIAYKILGDDKMLFISDSLRAAGMKDGKYSLAGLTFIVDGGKARLEDGTIAGSTCTLFDCVKNAISFGIPAESAFKMASLTPAKACKIDNVCGSISAGKRADLLILDSDFNIEKIVIRGELYN